MSASSLSVTCIAAVASTSGGMCISKLSHRPRLRRLDISSTARKLRGLMSSPAQFENVTAIAKANIYFDGKVVSHTVLLASGEKKTLGLIYPGRFHFGTDKAECMEIVAGACSVKLDGASTVTSHAAGSAFGVPAKSGFDIEVADGICEYVCSFLDQSSGYFASGFR